MVPCGDGGVPYPRGDDRALRLATRAACDMRTIIRRAKLEDSLTNETLRWIAAHDAEDAARIKRENENGIRERTRRRALRKLNLDERRVLGL